MEDKFSFHVNERLGMARIRTWDSFVTTSQSQNANRLRLDLDPAGIRGRPPRAASGVDQRNSAKATSE